MRLSVAGIDSMMVFPIIRRPGAKGMVAGVCCSGIVKNFKHRGLDDVAGQHIYEKSERVNKELMPWHA
jgi:hypothetical protein